MEFRKYSKIENSYQKKHVDFIRSFVDKDELWCVTEKVHGCNFSISYDGADIKCGKRTSFLESDDNFNNFQEIMDYYEDSIQDLYNESGAKDTITVYGELCGGSYSHPDVKANSTAKRVQKGVFYSPNNEFLVFDIVVDGRMISYNETVELCDFIGIPVIDMLLVGTLDECLNYPNAFESEIYKSLGLPEIDDNTCEGVVIKPVIPRYMPNGQRIILKNKNEKWTEKMKVPKKHVDMKEPLSKEAQFLRESGIAMVNDNRLRNVLSKESHEFEMKDFGVLMKLLSVDVYEDFNSEYTTEFNGLAGTEKKRIKKAIGNEISGVIKRNIQDIINGEF